jgi:two-component system nitrogen regulation response regulator GlnG
MPLRRDDEKTLKSVGGGHHHISLPFPVLTIACHPDPARVGDRRPLVVDGEGRTLVSRSEGSFACPEGGRDEPLGDRRISRRPVTLIASEGGSVELVTDPEGTPLQARGEIIDGSRLLSPAEVQQGVDLELGSRVVLLLHDLTIETFGHSPTGLGLVGQSGAITLLRRRINRVAKRDATVLLRGESGTGKELVAQALHSLSHRSDQPFVSVNMAAIPESTAAAALFGHAKGAFTGAAQASEGYFGAARGGTLFLDEIGEAPIEIQVALLRALESGEVQPVGEARPRKVDLRLIAATDANLERAMDAGSFRRGLFERLRGYQLEVAPLRDRPEDIGLLLLHFLRHELAAADYPDRLAAPTEDQRPWLPAWLVAMALRHRWPGNVRELRNLASQLVIDWGDAGEILADAGVEGLFEVDSKAGAPNAASPKAAPVAAAPAARDLSEEAIMAALKANQWRPAAAATALGISRSSLYAIIQKSPSIPKASALDGQAIEAALAAQDGDVAAAATQLRVSGRALKLRMKELEIG